MKHSSVFGLAAVLLAIVVFAGFAMRYRSTAEVPLHDMAAHEVPLPATAGEISNAASLGAPVQPVIGEEVAYFGDRKGHFVRPVASGTYPGVVMIHEWWGLTDGVREEARALAGEGYLVFAVDLFGTVATTSEDARKQTGTAKQDVSNANMRAAAAYLRSHGAAKLASLGWCYGGGQSLQLSLSGEPLDATVMYYGQVVTDPERLKALHAPVLGIFAGDDRSITAENVGKFDAALDQVGVANSVHIYPGVGHAFANPTGASYAPEETKDAWAKTLAFLGEHLR
ncbi:MAG TPA: dienelactone hydrolase family protein [Candidatus Paceibacterota bacterium]|nr:dienelactone hydrolase family protein [Candidatus Paceibacterota bacterium]